MWVIFLRRRFTAPQCKFRGALPIERLPLLLVSYHKVNICLLLSSVPFHRRGFNGSSRIQLHLVCFFPLWKTIVNFSVSHRNGAVIAVYCFASRHFRVFENVPDHSPLSCRSRRKHILRLSLFLQVGRITHKYAFVKTRTKTSLLYKSKREISFIQVLPPVRSSRDFYGTFRPIRWYFRGKMRHNISFRQTINKRHLVFYLSTGRALELSFSLEMIYLFEPYELLWGLDSFWFTLLGCFVGEFNELCRLTNRRGRFCCRAVSFERVRVNITWHSHRWFDVTSCFAKACLIM